MEDSQVDFLELHDTVCCSEFIPKETHFGKKPRKEVIGGCKIKGERSHKQEVTFPPVLLFKECGPRWIGLGGQSNRIIRAQ